MDRFHRGKLSLEKYRKKKDLINFSFTERSIPMAISGGTLFATMLALFQFFADGKPKE